MNRFIFVCGRVRIDPQNRRLLRDGRDVAIEPKAFAVLTLLLERADELVTRDELLDAVWGHRHVTPATLNRAVTLLRRVFDDDADHPQAISTVHRAGYRFIGAVERINAARHEEPARFGPSPSAQLPSKLEPLIGRERELEQLCALVDSHRAVTIIGSGGMGKTQCALEVGRLCSGRFPDGVWFFDLSPFERAHEWLLALAAALSVPPAAPEQLLPHLASALTDRRALLLLDNCDRVAAEVGKMVFALLRACGDLRILTTSQQRLDFVGEHLMWMPALTLPPQAAQALRFPIAEIAAIPSVALMMSRAQAVQPALDLDAGNVGDIVELCHRLEGMPLAIEMAAAQFAMFSPAAIRNHLKQHFGLLASASAGREPRHQTLEALMDWSFGLLSAEEQRLLCWLGVFLQGWTIDAAEHFGDAIGIRRDRLLQLHSSLILKSLVVVDPTLSPPRYRQLETVRFFALRHLQAQSEEATARRIHLEYFVQLGERSHREICALRSDEWLERLRYEHANIDGALTWARMGGADPDSAMRLAGSLMLYGKCQGLIGLLAGWMERVLDGVSLQASPTYLRALLCSGLFKVHTLDSAAGSQLIEAVALADRLGDRWAQGCAAAYLAIWQANAGQVDAASTHAALAAELAELEADDWLRSLTGLAKSFIALRSDRHADAIDFLLPLRLVSFDPHQHLMVDIYLALSNYGLGHWQDAAGLLLDVFALSTRTRNLRAQGGAMELTAYLARGTGRLEDSARLIGKAAEIRERTRAPLFSLWTSEHGKVIESLCEQLGRKLADAIFSEGASVRDEVVVERARTLLREIAAGQDPAMEPPAA